MGVVLRVGARRARRLLLVAGLVFAALPAGSALADTTIGKTGGGDLSCAPNGAVFADTAYVVPSGGGTITSFSFQSTSANKGQQLDFLVLRHRVLTPPGGDDYVVVGKTGVVTLKGTGLETFSANISVAGGDILGWWSPSEEIKNCIRGGTGAVAFTQFNVNSDPDTGDVFAMPSGQGLDLNESATLASRVGAPPPPTSKQQCKHGGWKNFGSRFKNQGQCVRFVNRQKKHHHKRHPSGLPVRVWES